MDPDNRGRVDFDRRISMLETIEQKLAMNQENLIDDLLDHWRGGGIKMFFNAKGPQVSQRELGTFSGWRLPSLTG